MIYSVWNQPSRQYDYYRCTKLQKKANTPKPTHLLRSAKLGLTVNQAAWPLPKDAIRIGSGPYARGRVASLSGSPMGAFDLDTNLVGFVGLGLAAFLLWKSGFLAPKTKRR